MIDPKNHFVSSCKRVDSTLPLVTVNLWEWLLSYNKNRYIIDEIRCSKDIVKCKRLKRLLPAVTPSGVFSERNANSLIEPTNLICIDIDGKDNPQIISMEETKLQLCSLPYIIYCGLSASGNGLFCIIQYEDYRNHKLHFNALQDEFKSVGIVVDAACSDICRLRFYSYDANAYINPNATIYNKVLEKEIHYYQPVKFDISKIENIEQQQESKTEYTQEEIAELLLNGTDFCKVSPPPLTPTQNVKRLLSIAIERKIDITFVYNDWITICYIIVLIYGEAGRDLFHQVSEFYPNYNPNETDTEFTKIEKKRYLRKFSALTEICAKYGII